MKKFGLFETMRFYQGGCVYFKQHLQRLCSSCQLLGIEFPEKIIQVLKAQIEKAKIKDAYVRLALWQDHQPEIIIRPYAPYSSRKYQRGLKVVISDLRQQRNAWLARLKTTERKLYEESLRSAKAGGFDEALILNNLGYLCEASRANIFFVEDKALFTPDTDCGCLAGITRQLVLDLAKKYKIPAYIGKFTPRQLLEAQEAFLTNSLIGIMPIACVAKQKFIKARPITTFFRKEYARLLRGN